VSSSFLIMQSIGLTASPFIIHSALHKLPQIGFLCMVCAPLASSALEQRP